MWASSFRIWNTKQPSPSRKSPVFRSGRGALAEVLPLPGNQTFFGTTAADRFPGVEFSARGMPCGPGGSGRLALITQSGSEGEFAWSLAHVGRFLERLLKLCRTNRRQLTPRSSQALFRQDTINL